jgi:glucans biosynthesis protein C
MEERRYFGFDALRGGMMMLGIVLHGVTFYLAAPPPTMPITTDRNTSYLMDLVFHYIHSFRMPVFFVMAGFFASLLVVKRGLVATWKNRAARVLLPFLAGLVVVLPATILFIVSFMVSVRFGTHDLIPSLADARAVGQEAIARHPEANKPSPLHLWFLYYLCYFYLLLPVLEFIGRRLAPLGARLGASAGSPLSFVALVACTMAALWPYRGAQVHEGFLFFVPHAPSLVYYGSFFALGYLLNASRAIEHLRLGRLRFYLAAGLASFPVAVYASHIDHAIQPHATDVHLFACLANAVCTWAWIHFFIAAALRLFDRPSPWALYVSQSSYWVFLAHMPVTAFAAWALATSDWPAIFKFALVVSFTSLVCFLSYHYWIQRSWVSVFLNGRRFDRDWPWRPEAR